MIILNDTTLDFGSFPNKETKMNAEQIVTAIQHVEVSTLYFKYEDDSDLIKLMLVKKYLDEFHEKVVLIIGYMPYSRMDRSENGSVFTLKYIADFINSLNFFRVCVIEPHSDVVVALLDRAEATSPLDRILETAIKATGFDVEEDYLLFPDSGAFKRYAKQFNDYNYLIGIKRRDFETGQILSFDLVGDPIIEKKPKVIIVDDLCSYGGTFMESGEKLKAQGASEVYLVVTHAEESIFKGEITTTDVIDGVFTTDSILKESLHEKVNVLPLT